MAENLIFFLSLLKPNVFVAGDVNWNIIQNSRHFEAHFGFAFDLMHANICFLSPFASHTVHVDGISFNEIQIPSKFE